MRNAVIVAMLLLGLALAVQAQDAGGGGGGSLNYSRMQIIKAPVVKIAGESMRLQLMSGGVSLKFIPENPEDDALRIDAQEIRFSWPDAGSQPDQIAMRGSVRVESPQGNIKSDKADLDMARKLLTFEGNVLFDSPQLSNLRATRIVRDLKTGDVTVENVSADDVFLGEGEGAPADPSLLRVDDVNDWSAFLALLGKQSREEAPSPGKQVVSLMDAKTRGFLDSITPETPLDAKVEKGAAKALNAVLRLSDMYGGAAWESVKLGDEVQQLIESGPSSLSESDLLRLNRLLLEAAYPEYVKGR